jgi:beta-glucosidase-like glycosyl hydrolase
MSKNPIIITFLAITCSLYSRHIELQSLTLDQKIGQLFMVAAVADEEIAHACLWRKSYRMDKEYIKELITTYHIGGIIYLGKSDKEKQIKRTQEFQQLSTIPLLIGQDLEPGRVGASRLPDVFDFPTNQALGTINDTDHTRSIAHTIGKLCTDLGVHINFAPVADVNNNPNNPIINDRSFSASPEIVTQHAIAFAQGLHDTGIIACAKHFPGHGDTDIDSHCGLPVITHNAERLNSIELFPFKALINAKIPALMIGHLVMPAFEAQENLPATLSPSIITDLLQKQLGFSGLIITDALDMQAITDHYTNGSAELLALLAGNDILLCPIDVPTAIAKIKQAIKDSVITEAEIDIHVEKILGIKNLLNISSIS